jgi:DNA polymerase III epsilon subunit-like protein/rubredoxin
MRAHTLEKTDDGYRCTTCSWTWAKPPQSRCPGLHRYGHIPEHLKTFTQLGKLGLKPVDRAMPDGCYYRWSDRTFIYLYDQSKTIQKRKQTDAQKKGREKAWRTIQEKYRCPECQEVPTCLAELKAYRPDGQLCESCYAWKQHDEEQRRIAEMILEDEKAACQWAAAMLQTDDWVILDTETTDLYGYLMEIAIVNKDGSTLFQSLINPHAPITPEARAIHSISDEELATAPALPDIWEQILQALAGKTTIITYNADFDKTVLLRDMRRYKLVLPAITWVCLMEKYAEYYGEYSEHFGDYKWQPLPGGTHRAQGDARAALHLLRNMAAALERSVKEQIEEQVE